MPEKRGQVDRKEIRHGYTVQTHTDARLQALLKQKLKICKELSYYCERVSGRLNNTAVTVPQIQLPLAAVVGIPTVR